MPLAQEQDEGDGVFCRVTVEHGSEKKRKASIIVESQLRSFSE
jgi:hypothetical protein